MYQEQISYSKTLVEAAELLATIDKRDPHFIPKRATYSSSKKRLRAGVPVWVNYIDDATNVIKVSAIIV